MTSEIQSGSFDQERNPAKPILRGLLGPVVLRWCPQLLQQPFIWVLAEAAVIGVEDVSMPAARERALIRAVGGRAQVGAHVRAQLTEDTDLVASLQDDSLAARGEDLHVDLALADFGELDRVGNRRGAGFRIGACVGHEPSSFSLIR